MTMFLVSGNSSAVEHNLAKVGVASSNLVSRLNTGFCIVAAKNIPQYKSTAGWQSGYAAACKAVYAGSIPALAW